MATTTPELTLQAIGALVTDRILESEDTIEDKTRWMALVLIRNLGRDPLDIAADAREVLAKAIADDIKADCIVDEDQVAILNAVTEYLMEEGYV